MLSHCLCVSAAVTEALLTNVRHGLPSGPQALQAYSLMLQDTPKGSRHSCRIRKPEPRDTQQVSSSPAWNPGTLDDFPGTPLCCSAASGASEAFTPSRLNSSLLDPWTAARPRYTEARVHFGQLIVTFQSYKVCLLYKNNYETFQR